ncbi:MAG TPA: hypothetical protein VMD59_17615, partial [Acidimicrobiales bacterium]|nr:hypothetical protein [Acidimicrobiales bacterium]
MASSAGFVVWCPACDWNVDPSPPKAEKRLRRRLSLAGDRLARRLFEQVRAHPETERRGRALSVVTTLLAGVVHLVTVALLGVAVWLLGGEPGILLGIRVACAAILVLLA